MPGLDVDLDLGPIEIMAGVRAELSRLNQHNEAMAAHRAQETKRARVPIPIRHFNSTVIPAGGGRTGFGFPGPRSGFYYIVRRLLIGGQTWITAAAGTAEVYVTGIPSGAINALQLGDMVDQSSFLPNKAYYSNEQVIIQAGEHMEIVIDSGTAGQTYVAAVQMQVFRTIAAGESFET